MSSPIKKTLLENYVTMQLCTLFLLSALMLGNCLSCRISFDFSHNLTLVNCSNSGLSSDDIRHLRFPETSTLILNDNNIKIFQNNSFLQFTGLKQLHCMRCNLRVLEVDALKGLNTLQALHLNDNYLKIIDHAFPLGFFRHVPDVKTLNIGLNHNEGIALNYSHFIDIFDSLPGLTDLIIDSFSNLKIGKEFTKLTNLSNLQIAAKFLEAISYDSFEGFQKSKVKHFSLLDCHPYSFQISENCFQYLPNVSSLSLLNVEIGNLNILRMMKSLQGRRIDKITFRGMELFHNRRLDLRTQEIILKSSDMQFLTNICVSNFEWTDSGIISLEPDAFISTLWGQCLKSLTFVTMKTNLITDNILLFFKTISLRNLESFVYQNNYNADFKDHFWKQKTTAVGSLHTNSKYRDSGFYMYQQLRKKREALFESSLTKHLPHVTYARFRRSGAFKIAFPPRLKTLVLDGIGTVNIDTDISVWKNNLQYLYVRDNIGIGVNFKGRLLGLSNLISIDFTRTRVQGKPSNFKWLPSVKKLILRNTQQDAMFFLQTAGNVSGLEYYDIADNHLERFPRYMFSLNKKLKYLCLASNRFSSIPFDLKLTPSLEILDLRMNSLVALSSRDRRAIEDHIHRVPNATFLLSGNPFSCACSSLPFLKWLQNNKVHFNQGGNYSCMSESGTLTFTGSFADSAALWRKCQGRYYFLVSFIMASTLVAFYLLVYLAMKHRTHVLSKLRQIVVPGFRLQTKQDFTYDVCIGYADQDGEYVRNVLLRYLENIWHLRTFVHQRDLLQDPLLMSHALRDSWRNVLLITENFLTGYSMAHNVMKVATFFVTPANPRSVVVIVEESVQHQIPDYVLQVVDEDNIIVLPQLEEFLDYEAKETLKTRILHSSY